MKTAFAQKATALIAWCWAVVDYTVYQQARARLSAIVAIVATELCVAMHCAVNATAETLNKKDETAETRTRIHRLASGDFTLRPQSLCPSPSVPWILAPWLRPAAPAAEARTPAERCQQKASRRSVRNSCLQLL